MRAVRNKTAMGLCTFAQKRRSQVLTISVGSYNGTWEGRVGISHVQFCVPGRRKPGDGNWMIVLLPTGGRGAAKAFENMVPHEKRARAKKNGASPQDRASFHTVLSDPLTTGRLSTGLVWKGKLYTGRRTVGL